MVPIPSWFTTREVASYGITMMTYEDHFNLLCGFNHKNVGYLN